jgi:hypothetical protein
VSGGGGEIARGFYFGVLGSGSRRLVRGVPVDALTAYISRYAALHRSLLPDVNRDPDASALAVVESFVRGSPATSPAGILEDFYLRTRMQRLAGRNSTTTGLFYRQATPFFANELVDLALALPTELKRNGWIVRNAILELCPSLAGIPLDSGAPVSPLSWRQPSTYVAYYRSLGRRGLVKYGGRAGRTFVRSRPPTVPWHAAAGSRVMRDFIGDLLEAADSRLYDLVDRSTVAATVHDAFEEGRFYRLGLFATLELTLRRVAGT